MIRFSKLTIYNLVFLCSLFAVEVRADLHPLFRHPSELLRWSKCIYRNTVYEAGDFVKTGEPCLNCTCTNGAIVCHLRVCTPIPNPPPTGCFTVHKSNMCCSELVCNDDNYILLDGLEGRSRPGANDENELELSNLLKFKTTACVINGTTYAEGSALSSSTDCKYCFCLKGQEQCMRPNCVLQLPGCAPVFSKHLCCPVRYSCYGSDNVTIISTELSLTSTNFTTSDNIDKLLSSGNINESTVNQEMKRNGLLTTRMMMSTTRMMLNEMKSTLHNVNGERIESSSVPILENPKPVHYTYSTKPNLKTEYISSAEFSEPEEENSRAETITEISTSIALLKAGLIIKSDSGNQSSNVEERKNTVSGIDAYSDSTQAYDFTSKTNFTNHMESAITSKTISPEIEAILNITKKKQGVDYELDYDEPTLPPSLPNLKIIPFVAADALDEPKDLTIQHREDVAVAVEVTDSILEPLIPLAGQFSPPIRTEGGFVPRDPILDGPFFESKYSNLYTQSTENPDNVPQEQAVLPSITEPAKVVENAICTNGQLTFRHGELISEPKACNMCLCMYGEIVCQKPECPTIKPGCRRINYEDLVNCCGEIICEDPVLSTSSSEDTLKHDVTSTSPENPSSESIATPNIAVTQPPSNPTYMTIKIKTKKPPEWKSTMPTTLLSPLTVVTQSTLPSSSRSTEKVDSDYDNGFSLENMLSFLFDEPSTPHKLKNATTEASTLTISTSTSTTSSTPITELLSSTVTTTRSTFQNVSNIWTSVEPMNAETDSAIYVIKNENQLAKSNLNYTDDSQVNTIKEINSYYVPPLGNFEEVILNPTKKTGSSGKKPLKANSYISTTFGPRHTTAKVVPPIMPTNITPQVTAGDHGAVSGMLKLSGCNIFGRMYRLGKIIAELSGPCLQCMCAEVGVHCFPLKC